MKKTFALKRFLTSLLVLSFVGLTLNSLTYSGGPPAGLTHAPGEGNCTQCHSGTLDTTSSNIANISLSGNFTGGGYIPDSTYTMTLSYSQSGISKFGFELTCLTSTNVMAGDFTKTSTATNKVTTTIGGATRQYMQHSGSGNSGSGSISWTFQWTAPSSNVDSVSYYVVINAANGNGGTSGDAIRAKKFKIGPSSLLPTAIASADTNIVCSGTPLQYYGSSSDTNSTYSWLFPFGSPSTSSSQNPVVSYSFQGTKYGILTVTNSKGVSKPDTVQITVRQNATAVINGSNRTICEGDSVELIAIFDAGSTYLWNTGQTGNRIWVKDTGSYQVTVGKNGCERSSNIIKVFHYTKPVVSLSSDASTYGDTSCKNNTLVLTATAGFDSFYYYENATELGRSASNSWTTVFDSATVYSVKVKNSTGCYSDLGFYTVHARPQLQGPTLSCSNVSPTSLTFNWDDTFYHNGFEISLDSGQSWTSPSSGTTGTSHNLSGLQPDQAVELWLRAFDNLPCSVSEISTIVCETDTCNYLDVSLQYQNRVCFGDQIEITVNGLKGEHYGLEFENSGVFNDTIFSFQPVISKNYILQVQDSANLACPAENIFLAITVDRMPEFELMGNKQDEVYCLEESAIFSVNDSFETVEWFYNNSSVQSGNSTTYSRSNLVNDDSLFVIAEYGVCKDTSLKVYVTVLENPNANFNYSRIGSVFSFNPENGSHLEYLWDFGDGDSSTAINPNHDYASKSNSTVNVNLRVKTDLGCYNDTTISIEIPNFADVEELAAAGIHIYPNPVEDILTIENTSSQGNLQLLDINGRIVYQDLLLNGIQRINLQHLSQGVYQLKVDLELNTYTQKIIKN